MKNILLLAILSLTITTSCRNNPERDLEKAKDIGTVAAYQHFIERHPAADTLTCEARFRKAMCDGSLPVLVDYLGCDPSKHRIEWMLEAIDSAMRYLDTMPINSVLNTWATTSNGQLKSHIEEMMFRRDEISGWAMVDRIVSSKPNNEYKRYACQSYLALYSGADYSHTIRASEMAKALRQSPANEIEHPTEEEVVYEYRPAPITYAYTAYVPVKILGIRLPIVKKETRYSYSRIAKPIRFKAMPSSATLSNIDLTAISTMSTLSLPSHRFELPNISIREILDSKESAKMRRTTDAIFYPIDTTKPITEPIESFDFDTYEDLLQSCEDSIFGNSKNNNEE